MERPGLHHHTSHRPDPQPDEYEAYGIDFDQNMPRTESELEDFRQLEEDPIEECSPLNLENFKVTGLPYVTIGAGEYNPFTDPREECKLTSKVQ